jgi:hypothetical protein
MTIALATDVKQVDSLSEDFNDFLKYRIYNASNGEMPESHTQAWGCLNVLLGDVEEKISRAFLLDLESAVAAVVVETENIMYDAGFQDGIRLMTKLLKD